MPQSLAQVWLHVIFSTKERRPFFQNSEFREEMFRMLAHLHHCQARRAGEDGNLQMGQEGYRKPLNVLVAGRLRGIFREPFDT